MSERVCERSRKRKSGERGERGRERETTGRCVREKEKRQRKKREINKEGHVKLSKAAEQIKSYENRGNEERREE